jgi:hypothetical protein
MMNLSLDRRHVLRFGLCDLHEDRGTVFCAQSGIDITSEFFLLAHLQHTLDLLIGEFTRDDWHTRSLAVLAVNGAVAPTAIAVPAGLVIAVLPGMAVAVALCQGCSWGVAIGQAMPVAGGWPVAKVSVPLGRSARAPYGAVFGLMLVQAVALLKRLVAVANLAVACFRGTL